MPRGLFLPQRDKGFVRLEEEKRSHWKPCVVVTHEGQKIWREKTAKRSFNDPTQAADEQVEAEYLRTAHITSNPLHFPPAPSGQESVSFHMTKGKPGRKSPFVCGKTSVQLLGLFTWIGEKQPLRKWAEILLQTLQADADSEVSLLATLINYCIGGYNQFR